MQEVELPQHVLATVGALQDERHFMDLVRQLGLTRQALSNNFATLRQYGVMRSTLWVPHRVREDRGWQTIIWSEGQDTWRVGACALYRRDRKPDRLPNEVVVVVEPGTAGRTGEDDPPPGLMLVPDGVRLSWVRHVDRMEDSGLGWVRSDEMRAVLLAAIGVALGCEVVLPAWRATQFAADVKIDPVMEDETDG